MDMWSLDTNLTDARFVTSQFLAVKVAVDIYRWTDRHKINSWVECKFLPVVSFAVCKFKAHKRCAVRANYNCKWTTLASIGKDIIENEDGVRALPSL